MQVTITVEATRTVEASSEDEACNAVQDMLEDEGAESVIADSMITSVDCGNVINIRGA